MTTARCPICGRRFDPQTSPAVPFCSERCRLIDLRRWLDERYPVSVERVADEEEEEEEEGEPRAADQTHDGSD
jgi:endogenous inhibitor of DNA gyrase (YacG/DUF329 family)